MLTLKKFHILNLLILFLLFACSSSNEKIQLSQPYSVHIKAQWYQLKASSTNKSVDEIKAIDSTLLNPQEVPKYLWQSDMLKRESKAIWLQKCSICHGQHGNLENIPVAVYVPRKFNTMGMSMGYFFGGDKMRKGIYRKIRDGIQKKGNIIIMPKWSDVLSYEQIWGLSFYIEDL